MNDTNKTISSSEHPKVRTFGWKKKKCVGIISPSYGAEKISYGCRPNGYTFNKILRLPLHRLETNGTFFNYTPAVYDWPVEIVHTFNELPVGVRPFVASFELEMPRYLGSPEAWKMDFGLSLMSSDRCKALLALSEIAASQLSRKLRQSGYDDIASKISVFRGTIGGSNRSINVRQQSTKDQPLRVLFVGRDAFRKGLTPTLTALEKCVQLGANIEVTIISDFEDSAYVSKFHKLDKHQMLNQMHRIPKLTHHHLLPNNEIKRLMASHDVLLFPTLDESLGWVAVEAGMAGMATVSTNIYAIPELVIDKQTGFLVDIDTNQNKRWSGLWLNGDEFSESVEKTFSCLHKGIVEALLKLSEDRELLFTMGKAAQDRMQSLYSLEKADRQLSKIYSDALS